MSETKIDANLAIVAIPDSAIANALKWIKITKTYLDLAAASTTNSVLLYTLPAKSLIHGTVIKHSTAFSGSGITGYSVSLGISGNNVKYASPFNVYQSVASNTAYASNTLGIEDFGSPTSINIVATSTGANLSQASAGSVDVWLLVSTLP